MNGFDYFEKALKQFTDFRGRASRKEFWYFILFNFLIHLSVSIYGGIMDSENFFVIANIVVFIALFLPRLAVLVRRLHDSGKSGWFALFGLFPPTGIVLFIFTLLRSEPRENKWGPDPDDSEEYWEEEDEDEEEFLEDFGDRSIPTRGRNRRY